MTDTMRQMATLADDAPIRTLGRILHAAAAFGESFWSNGDDSADGPLRSDVEPHADAASLSSDLLDLFRLLHQRKAQYLLVGGVALLRYVTGRNTDDVDLIIAVEALDRVPELEVRDRNSDAARARFRSLRVDLLFTANAVFSSVLNEHRTEHRFAELSVPCATAEGLVLLKLYALPRLYREGDLQRAALFESDITMLAERQSIDLDAPLQALKPYLGEGEANELQSIVADIQQRLARMRLAARSDDSPPA